MHMLVGWDRAGSRRCIAYLAANVHAARVGEPHDHTGAAVLAVQAGRVTHGEELDHL